MGVGSDSTITKEDIVGASRFSKVSALAHVVWFHGPRPLTQALTAFFLFSFQKLWQNMSRI